MHSIAKPGHKIPQRNSLAGKNLCDLSPFYTHSLHDDIHHKPGNNLSDLGEGIITLNGCDFDVRGVVQLAGKDSENITSLIYPVKTGPVKIGFQVSKLHFLHATAWNIDSEICKSGEYRIIYQDDSVAVIPLVYRENIRDWWGKAGEEGEESAWKGSNERTESVEHHLRLFHMVWSNPEPSKSICGIEIKSTNAGPGLMVVAITADPA